MSLYDPTRVKSMLGETGTSNDSKILTYGTMADNFVIGDLVKVKGLPNPPAVTVGVLTQAELDNIKLHATLITVSYFYKFESGDTITAEAAELSWKQYYQNKFKSPRFITSTGSI